MSNVFELFVLFDFIIIRFIIWCRKTTCIYVCMYHTKISNKTGDYLKIINTSYAAPDWDFVENLWLLSPKLHIQPVASAAQMDYANFNSFTTNEKCF